MMVRCEACGTEYENPVSSICDNCGMRITRAMPKEADKPEYSTCPGCGTRNRDGVRICCNCGNLIRPKTV